MEDSALNWCSDHRRHHKHTDHDHDPYNIQLGFWHAHIGWIMFRRDLEKTLDNVKDLERDPLIRWQHRWWAVIGIGLGFGLPTLLGYMLDGVLGALGRATHRWYGSPCSCAPLHIFYQQPLPLHWQTAIFFY